MRIEFNDELYLIKPCDRSMNKDKSVILCKREVKEHNKKCKICKYYVNMGLKDEMLYVCAYNNMLIRGLGLK